MAEKQNLQIKNKERPKVVVDCDAGSDDVFALAMLIAAHKLENIELLAITCVDGNTSVDNVVKNVFRTLHICDASNVLVFSKFHVMHQSSRKYRETPSSCSCQSRLARCYRKGREAAAPARISPIFVIIMLVARSIQWCAARAMPLPPAAAQQRLTTLTRRRRRDTMAGSTLVRCTRGIVYASMWYASIIAGFLFLACPFLWVLLVSPPLFRRCAELLFSCWEMYPSCLMELLGPKILMTGEHIDPRDSALLVMNHRTRVDWNFLWGAMYQACQPRIAAHKLKFVLKDPVKHVPGPGWMMQINNFLYQAALGRGPAATGPLARLSPRPETGRAAAHLPRGHRLHPEQQAALGPVRRPARPARVPTAAPPQDDGLHLRGDASAAGRTPGRRLRSHHRLSRSRSSVRGGSVARQNARRGALSRASHSQAGRAQGRGESQEVARGPMADQGEAARALSQEQELRRQLRLAKVGATALDPYLRLLDLLVDLGFGRSHSSDGAGDPDHEPSHRGRLELLVVRHVSGLLAKSRRSQAEIHPQRPIETHTRTSATGRRTGGAWRARSATCPSVVPPVSCCSSRRAPRTTRAPSDRRTPTRPKWACRSIDTFCIPARRDSAS
ncbi:unnamed protein product [Trichogramma brassicae]|uniref:Phospholipid/glycerol acyltransferase domain-containing protein n=1 Tax=Trichogramma brassicae TaxID=86971 RepID=A0A6H5J690_9HYME|nr:unnamed protein product [Trichogramma brassicae]